MVIPVSLQDLLMAAEHPRQDGRLAELEARLRTLEANVSPPPSPPVDN